HSVMCVGNDDDPGSLRDNRTIVPGTELLVCNAMSNQSKNAGRVRLLAHGTMVRGYRPEDLTTVYSVVRKVEDKLSSRCLERDVRVYVSGAEFDMSALGAMILVS